jgi:hypothetical protein
MGLANTLDYYDTTPITIVNVLYYRLQGACTIKHFTDVMEQSALKM